MEEKKGGIYIVSIVMGIIFLFGIDATLGIAEEENDVPDGIVREIKDYESLHGAEMSTQEFESLITKNLDMLRDYSGQKNKDISVLLREVLAVWQSSRKQGVIGTNDLLEMFKAKRESILDLDIEYGTIFNANKEKCNGIFKSGSGIYKYSMDSRIVMSGEKIYKSVKMRGTNGEALQNELIQAYNGKCEMVYEQTFNQGTIKKHDDINKFFTDEEDYWMAFGCLLGNKIKGTTDLRYYDLIDTLTNNAEMVYIRPGYESVNGCKTIVVEYGVPPVERIYLDPEKGYAPIKMERNTEINGIAVLVQNDYSNFVDAGNGLWIPAKVKIAYLRSNQIGGYDEYMSFEHTGKSIKVNKDVDEKLFEADSIFPIGALIVDDLVGVSYHYKVGQYDVQDVLNDVVNEIKSSGQKDPNPTVNPKTQDQVFAKASIDEIPVNSPKNTLYQNNKKYNFLWLLLIFPLVLLVLYSLKYKCRKQ